MAKAILDAIEQLEIYTTNKVQEWKEIMQRPSNSEEQDRVATAVKLLEQNPELYTLQHSILLFTV